MVSRMVNEMPKVKSLGNGNFLIYTLHEYTINVPSFVA